jgi:hypothetical protein
MGRESPTHEGEIWAFSATGGGVSAQYAEGVIVSVEQHLVGLWGISAKKEGAALGQLEVGDL